MKLTAEISFEIDAKEIYKESKKLGFEWDFSDFSNYIEKYFQELIRNQVVQTYEASPWGNSVDKDSRLNKEKIEKKILEKIKRRARMRWKMANPIRRIR